MHIRGANLIGMVGFFKLLFRYYKGNALNATARISLPNCIVFYSAICRAVRLHKVKTSAGCFATDLDKGVEDQI
jgi:hypothetical protein